MLLRHEGLSYCLKLFEASTYGSVCEDQEDRRGELNRWRSHSTARIEFFGNNTGANAALYNEQNIIHQFFLANPEIKPYFYDKKSIAEGSEDYVKVMLAAEMLGDFFEHIYLQKTNLPRKIWPWCNYMNYLYKNSPSPAITLQ